MNKTTTYKFNSIQLLLDSIQSAVSTWYNPKKYWIALSILITILMVALPCWLYIQDISYSTQFEESVGYRYFHSLRLLYSNEKPWLPQGQLPGILHIAIQKLLTFAGYPKDQFFPRIDLFSFWAVIIPLVVTGRIYAWAVKPLKTLVSQSIFAIIFLACFFSPRFQDGWMLLPDYHIWMVPLALIAIGWSMRILSPDLRSDGLTTKNAIIIGIYAGACLSVKVTLFTYPLTLGLLLFLYDPQVKDMFKTGYKSLAAVTLKITANVVISYCIAIITWLIVLTIYYQGDFSILPTHFKSLISFSGSQVVIAKNLQFFEAFYPITALDLFPMVLLMLLYTMFNRNSLAIAFVILPPSILELYMLYQRNYSHTNIEVQYLFLIVATIFVIMLSQKSNFKMNKNLQITLNSCVILVLLFAAINHTKYSLSRIKRFIPYLQNLDGASKGLHQALNHKPGKTLFLIPITTQIDDVNMRTIDNGLLKAGTDWTQTVWDPDSYMAKLYSNRSYAINAQTIPNLAKFDNIVFKAQSYESLNSAIARLEEHYNLSLKAFNCASPYYIQGVGNAESLVLCTK